MPTRNKSNFPSESKNAAYSSDFPLTSAIENEISPSGLMEGNPYKTTFVPNGAARGAQNRPELAESMSRVMKNLVRVQRLLRSNLENLEKMKAGESFDATAQGPAPEAGSVTRGNAQMQRASALSAAARRQSCACCLMGTSQGAVTNRLDRYDNRTVILSAFLSPRHPRYNSIRYTIDGDCGVQMRADPNHLRYVYPSAAESRVIRIWGRATLNRALRRTDLNTNGRFELYIWFGEAENVGFQMAIQSEDGRTFSHDSGFVLTTRCDRGLRLN